MLGPLFARGLGSVVWVAAAAAGAGMIPHAFGPPGLGVGLVGAPPPLPGVLFVPASPSPQAAPMTVQVVVQPMQGTTTAATPNSPSTTTSTTTSPSTSTQTAPQGYQVTIIQSPASPQTIPAPAGGPQGPTSSFPTGMTQPGQPNFSEGFAANPRFGATLNQPGRPDFYDGLGPTQTTTGAPLQPAAGANPQQMRATGQNFGFDTTPANAGAQNFGFNIGFGNTGTPNFGFNAGMGSTGSQSFGFAAPAAPAQ
jgi:hypothetical protein